jgi:hypothetical protein
MASEAAMLPNELRAVLDGADIARRSGLVFELLTVAPTGWPHVSLLSVGEVVVVADDRIGLALWPNSTTTDNLRGSGRGVLQVYLDGAAYRVRLAVAPIADEADGKLALFLAQVDGVVLDAVSYARITSGPTIELVDIERVVTRWQAQVETIRRAVATLRSGDLER